MKKMLVLLASLLVLTACAQTKKETTEATANKTEQTTKASSSAKEEQALKFVVAPQYEGKTSDLIELGKKLVKEHPDAGKQGEITLYYTGSTYTLNQPTQSATIFLLPLTKEQQSIIESITDGTKMSLSMSDLMMK